MVEGYQFQEIQQVHPIHYLHQVLVLAYLQHDQFKLSQSGFDLLHSRQRLHRSGS